jgi:sugar phosphate permease
MGILPACTVKIKDELSLDNTWFGFLGSVVYGGQVIGSAIASGVLQKCNPKTFLSVCLFLNIITLVIFTLTDVYILLAFCRMCTGLF